MEKETERRCKGRERKNGRERNGDRRVVRKREREMGTEI